MSPQTICIISKCGMNLYQLVTNLSSWLDFIDNLPKDILNNYRTDAIERYKIKTDICEVPVSLYVLYKGDSPCDYYSIL